MNLRRTILAVLIAFCAFGCRNQQKSEPIVVIEKKQLKTMSIYFSGEEQTGWVEGQSTFAKKGSIADALKTINDVDFNSVVRLVVAFDGLVSLEGIEQLPNLESVSINSSRVTDISPLLKLPKLTTIIAAYNQIKTVPDFSVLANLKELNLENNPLVDYANLRKLTFLKKVVFSFYPPDDKAKENEAYEINVFLRNNGVRCFFYSYRAQTTDE